MNARRTSAAPACVWFTSCFLVVAGLVSACGERGALPETLAYDLWSGGADAAGIAESGDVTNDATDGAPDTPGSAVQTGPQPGDGPTVVAGEADERGGSGDAPVLEMSPDALDFGGAETVLTVQVHNAGGGTMEYTISADQSWISVNPASGTNQGAYDEISVQVDRAGLESGAYNGALLAATADGQQRDVSVSMAVPAPPDEPPPPPPTGSGACCLADGSCTAKTAAECAGAGGDYQGDGVSCADANCPQPRATGACCLADGSCNVEAASDCAAAAGTYQGDDTSCVPDPCPPPAGSGPCCFPDGSCDVKTAAECAGAGGDYQGDGVSCADATCPQPPATGACCLADGSCSVEAAPDCAAAAGTYQGDDTSCVPSPCPPPPGSGACCFPDGSCDVKTAIECGGANGDYQGDGVTCAAAACPPPDDPPPADDPTGPGRAAYFFWDWSVDEAEIDGFVPLLVGHYTSACIVFIGDVARVQASLEHVLSISHPPELIVGLTTSDLLSSLEDVAGWQELGSLAAWCVERTGIPRLGLDVEWSLDGYLYHDVPLDLAKYDEGLQAFATYIPGVQVYFYPPNYEGPSDANMRTVLKRTRVISAAARYLPDFHAIGASISTYGAYLAHPFGGEYRDLEAFWSAPPGAVEQIFVIDDTWWVPDTLRPILATIPRECWIYLEPPYNAAQADRLIRCLEAPGD